MSTSNSDALTANTCLYYRYFSSLSLSDINGALNGILGRWISTYII